MIKTLAISAVVLAVAIVGGVLHFTDADPVVTFGVCGIRDRLAGAEPAPRRGSARASRPA